MNRESSDALRVLDVEHLTKYTAGDVALRDELLALFREQLRIQAQVLRSTTDLEDWHIATHTLKGAARAVGAWAIADVSEALEALQPGHGDCAGLIDDLDRQIEICGQRIDELSQAA